MSTEQQFHVRPGQTWKEQDPHLGMRVCIVEKIQRDQVFLRTVFNEGLIGSCATSVPMHLMLNHQSHWQFVSEPGQYPQ